MFFLIQPNLLTSKNIHSCGTIAFWQSKKVKSLFRATCMVPQLKTYLTVKWEVIFKKNNLRRAYKILWCWIFWQVDIVVNSTLLALTAILNFRSAPKILISNLTLKYHLINIPAKFGSNGLSGFNEEDWNLKKKVMTIAHMILLVWWGNKRILQTSNFNLIAKTVTQCI